MTGRSEGWLKGALPVAMQDDELISQFASLVEFMSEDIQQHIDEFRVIADCSVTPTDLISWLGSFVDAPVTEALDEHDRRRLLADLGQGLRRRSTKAHIETVVGAYVDGEFDVIDAGGVYRSGSSNEVTSKVVVRIRQEPDGGVQALEATLRAIVPAHCLLELQTVEG
ncbi:MAG TPA: hypothetical protein DCE10_08865 [Acidimicrobiaceae bacterium]|mgnify:FL=1|nr:hypothetical protein [Acidimicrobiaceae bacterium]